MPDVTLTGPNGPVKLRDHIGKPLVVYFYPADDTYGCTIEACSFRDSYEDFVKAGAEVIGVSGDSVAKHQAFAQHHRLPFTLLADDGNQLRKAYGVPSTLWILPGRVTYVIDKGGVVRHVFDSQMQETKHISEALAVINSLASN